MKVKITKPQFVVRTTYAVAGLLVSAAALMPLLAGTADASQITARSLTLGSGVPSAVTTYAFNFTVPSATVIKSFSAQACTTAVGACTTPTGFSVSAPGATLTAQPTGFGAASGWTVNTATAGQLRALNASNATAPSSPLSISFSNVTSPSTANTAFFLRLTTYSDSGWTTAIDTGTTASAVVQSLTVNAAVAEILNFCVGNTSVDDMTTDPTSGAAHDCTSISGTSVNLGTLDTGHVNVTPVSTNCSALDCSKNGIALVRSNANSGVVVQYDALAQSGTNHTRALRVAGQTCDATDPSLSITDACFNSRGWNGTVATGNTIAAGTENFGMTVAGINCGSTTSYVCTGSSNSDLVRNSANSYNGNGANTYTSEANQSVTTTTTNKYAWDESGTPMMLATSASSASKVVDDEALILKFAGTPSITTPFGLYTAQADFIAIPTY